MNGTIFHLAFPVRDLQQAQAFYVDVLGARIGRRNPAWMDIMLFGAQITLHEKPAQVLARDDNGVRHFGATLPWARWQAYADDLTRRMIAFRMRPTVSHQGTEIEQAKLMIEDPSGNLIELKCYRNPAAALGMEDGEAGPGLAP
jgi:uncharacterized protein